MDGMLFDCMTYNGVVLVAARGHQPDVRLAARESTRDGIELVLIEHLRDAEGATVVLRKRADDAADAAALAKSACCESRHAIHVGKIDPWVRSSDLRLSSRRAIATRPGVRKRPRQLESRQAARTALAARANLVDSATEEVVESSCSFVPDVVHRTNARTKAAPAASMIACDTCAVASPEH